MSTSEPEHDYEHDPAYCGAVTTWNGHRVVCWRSADHNGAHQGLVAEDDVTYSWAREPLVNE
jgi:hypothetical protein